VLEQRGIAAESADDERSSPFSETAPRRNTGFGRCPTAGIYRILHLYPEERAAPVASAWRLRHGCGSLAERVTIGSGGARARRCDRSTAVSFDESDRSAVAFQLRRQQPFHLHGPALARRSRAAQAGTPPPLHPLPGATGRIQARMPSRRSTRMSPQTRRGWSRR
jgi:hypothetical protein